MQENIETIKNMIVVIYIMILFIFIAVSLYFVVKYTQIEKQKKLINKKINDMEIKINMYKELYNNEKEKNKKQKKEKYIITGKEI